MKKENNLIFNEFKFEIFKYFKENDGIFPRHCTDIVFLLGSFLKKNNYEFKILKLEKKFCNNANFHRVILLKNQIIDFSLFQFYIPKQYKLKDLSTQDSYEFAINEIQQGKVVFDKRNYLKRFKTEFEYESLEDIANLYGDEIIFADNLLEFLVINKNLIK